MKSQDFDVETNAKIVKRVRYTKVLSCSYCKPHRNENRMTKKKKHGTRPPRSKQRRRA